MKKQFLDYISARQQRYSMMTPFKNWPYKWFGCWQEMGAGFSDCPSIYDWINPNEIHYYGDNLPHIIQYLASGYELVATSAINFPNVITKELRIGALCFRTDGVWVWQDDLGDYIAKNQVTIPREFYDHMVNQKFTFPDFDTIKPDELEWPP